MEAWVEFSGYLSTKMVYLFTDVSAADGTSGFFMMLHAENY